MRDTYFQQSLTRLDEAVTGCDVNGIRLSVESLAIDYGTACIVEGEVPHEFRVELAYKMACALESLPANAHERMTERIRQVIKDVRGWR